MQWLQLPNQSDADNLNNVRREVDRHFRNKKKECLNAKNDEFETMSEIKNIREFYMASVTLGMVTGLELT